MATEVEMLMVDLNLGEDELTTKTTEADLSFSAGANRMQLEIVQKSTDAERKLAEAEAEIAKRRAEAQAEIAQKYIEAELVIAQKKAEAEEAAQIVRMEAELVLAQKKAEAEEAAQIVRMEAELVLAQKKAELEQEMAQRLAELERREQEQKEFMQAQAKMILEEKETPNEREKSQTEPDASLEPKPIQKLNGWQVSSQPWAEMVFLGNVDSSTSRSKNRSHLNDVVLLENFEPDLEEFFKTHKKVLEGSYPVRNFMPQASFFAQSEGDIQKILNDWVYTTMDGLLGDCAQMLKSVAGMGLRNESRADGYCVANDPRAVVAVVEAKKPSLSACGTDLVKQVQDKRANKPKSRLDALDACQQAAGYSIQAGTAYGFIMTFSIIWCYVLDKDAVMHVSPGFPTNVSGLKSGFNVMYYWTIKALTDDLRNQKLPLFVPVTDGRRSKKKTEPPPQPDQQDAARGKENESQQQPTGRGAAKGGSGKQRALATYNGDRRGSSCPAGILCCRAADAGLTALRASLMLARDGLAAAAGAAPLLLLEALAEHRDRITWRALLPDGAQAVVKAYDCADDRDLEVECYDALLPLQGRSVPSVLRRRLLLEAPGPSAFYADDAADDPRVHAIVLSWAGPEEGPARAGLSEADLRRARRVFRRMHGRGVVHGDVHPRNMTVDPASGRVIVFDFSHAATLASLGGDRASFGDACAEDMRRLDKHLARAAEAAASAEGATRTALLGLR